MNCHEAYLWMLEAEEPTASPPVTVIEHLRDCGKCRRRHKRVLRLLTAVKQLPSPPENPQARAEVMSIVRQTTVAPRRPARSSGRANQWWWRGVLSAAAVVLLGFFGALLYYFRDRTEPVTPLADVVRHAWNDGDLRTRLLQRDLRLAEASVPGEQLETLTGMATDLGHESIKQAGRVDNADLTLLAMLYEVVLRDGVLPRARSLPAAERQERIPAIQEELRQTETEAEQAAIAQPAAAEPLRRLAQAAGDSARQLEAPKSDTPFRKPKALESSGLLIETLVVQGLRLADETDPLKRADVCTEVADSLVQTIVEASNNGGNREEMVKLGTYFGAMDRAIVNNLDRVEIANADAKRRKEIQRVRGRSDQTRSELRRKVQVATPTARPGLEQALEASTYPGPLTITSDIDKDKK